MSQTAFDVAVVGAGVVGAAIARALSHHDLRCVVLEAGQDVGIGTSKANTAIWHTGFDAKPGSLEASLLRRGYPLMTDFAAKAGIPIQTTGAVLVAWDEHQQQRLTDIEANAHANGVQDLSTLSTAQVYAMEPNLGPGAHGGLLVPGEGIICPFTVPLALATDAVANGVSFKFGHRVLAVHARDTAEGLIHQLDTSHGPVSSRWVVNAAGLGSDEINRLFGHDTFTVTPRRGQLIVFDKTARGLLSRVILPVPSAKTKGVLVAPTVFGNVLLGPTAEDLQDKSATQTTADGLAQLLDKGRPIMPRLLSEEVTATYAGLRAATEHSDYQISTCPEQQYVCVGGIRSTGLSASLGIAAHVMELLADAGLKLREKTPVPIPRMPMIGEAFTRPYQDHDAIAADPDAGHIVCHCERVTHAEIVAAARATVPAADLDGLRRRTRAMMGRCQGFYCTAAVTATFSNASGKPVSQLLGEERPS